MFSEKATKFEEISLLFLTLPTYFPQSFVAFSRNLNFEYVPVLTRQFFTDVNLGRLYIGQVNVIGKYVLILDSLDFGDCRFGNADWEL